MKEKKRGMPTAAAPRRCSNSSAETPELAPCSRVLGPTMSCAGEKSLGRDQWRDMWSSGLTLLLQLLGCLPTEGQHGECAVGARSDGCHVLGCCSAQARDGVYCTISSLPCFGGTRDGNCHVSVFRLVAFLVPVFSRVRVVVLQSVCTCCYPVRPNCLEGGIEHSRYKLKL